ncbi:DUF423 domain-containing protein [Aureimonas sp. ME7]|uniref:DUF423 domain-containing protein n=1 Tax=Aureimonas sp. ME7 TaxID=2744252 RepID=UPI001FCE8BA3|nr:DUF423 domain-containing protein [Aureimonas sp. ME7]
MNLDRSSASSRVCLGCAGLLGAFGTGGAAFAAHGGANAWLAGIAAAIAFVHAPALLALAFAPREMLRTRLLPAGLMVLGVGLFSGDLAMRLATGERLFPNAAPIGGSILILAWASLILLAVWPRRAT